MDLSPLQTTVNRNLVKYAVGLAIFCPRCENILDAKRAVVFPNSKGNNQVACGPCFDKADTGLVHGAMGGIVQDGRVLWARAPRAAKPKAAKPAAKRGSFAPLYRAFIAGLKAQGCVLCRTCNAYLAPTHTHTQEA